MRTVEEQSIAMSMKITAAVRKVETISNEGGVSNNMTPLSNSLDSELEAAAKELKKKQKVEFGKLKEHIEFQQYVIKGDDSEWKEALQIKDKSKLGQGNLMISVKTGEKRLLQDQDGNEHSDRKKKKKTKSKEKSGARKAKT